MEEKVHILIVDDEEDTCWNLAQVFGKMGYETETARTGEEALEKARGRFFNVVLVDIRLPDMEGIELLAPLKEMHPYMALIIITGYASVKTAVQAINSMASGYITKPLDMNEVLSKVGNVLETQRLIIENRRLYEAAQKELAERKHAEELLRESEERMKAILSASPVGIGLVVNRQLDWANQTMYRMMGYEQGSLIGQSARILYPDDREYRRVRQELYTGIAESGIGQTETRWVRKDGTIFNCSLRICSLDPKDPSKGQIVAVTDISKSRRLEAQLRQAQKMEAIGTLAGGIAHDFNNILAAIIGYADVAGFQVDEDSKAKDSLKEVVKAGHRAKNLIRQILAFSRQSEQERMPMQMRSIVNESIKLLRASLPTTIEIRQNIESDIGAIEADPTQMQQIIMNLCTNAHQAMSEEGGILEINLSETDLDFHAASQYLELSPGKYVRLTVSDTGHGMDKEIMERIFEPYFTTKGKERGTGLGLSVVHGIVKSHEGAITVYSEPGKGSTFHVYIPVIQWEVVEEKDEIEPLPTGHERILFIDDEPALVDIGRQMLERLGYKVYTRTSSLEALELFKAQPDRFHLVITDMTMPNMTGDRLARELMKIRPDIPIILCTGFSERITEEKAKKIGIKEFVMKPLVMRDLANSVREVLDNSASFRN